MKLIYKPVKEDVAHCGVCGERLRGNGGFERPYECPCGVWEWGLAKGEFVLRKT